MGSLFGSYWPTSHICVSELIFHTHYWLALIFWKGWTRYLLLYSMIWKDWYFSLIWCLLSFWAHWLFPSLCTLVLLILIKAYFMLVFFSFLWRSHLLVILQACQNILQAKNSMQKFGMRKLEGLYKTIIIFFLLARKHICMPCERFLSLYCYLLATTSFSYFL